MGIRANRHEYEFSLQLTCLTFRVKSGSGIYVATTRIAKHFPNSSCLVLWPTKLHVLSASCARSVLDFLRKTPQFLRTISLFVRKRSLFTQKSLPFLRNSSLFVRNSPQFVWNISPFVRKSSVSTDRLYIFYGTLTFYGTSVSLMGNRNALSKVDN